MEELSELKSNVKSGSIRETFFSDSLGSLVIYFD